MTVRAPIVVVPTQNPKFNLSAAESFGTLTYLSSKATGKSINPFKTGAAIEEICERLAQLEYDPDRDFVAMTGGTLLVTLLVLAVVARHGRVKVLFFDAVNNTYVVRELASAAFCAVKTTGGSP